MVCLLPTLERWSARPVSDSEGVQRCAQPVATACLPNSIKIRVEKDKSGDTNPKDLDCRVIFPTCHLRSALQDLAAPPWPQLSLHTKSSVRLPGVYLFTLLHFATESLSAKRLSELVVALFSPLVHGLFIMNTVGVRSSPSLRRLSFAEVHSGVHHNATLMKVYVNYSRD